MHMCTAAAGSYCCYCLLATAAGCYFWLLLLLLLAFGVFIKAGNAPRKRDEEAVDEEAATKRP